MKQRKPTSRVRTPRSPCPITNILADRLKRLEETGLLTKEPYQSNPVRHQYRLTRKGAELFPVLREIIRWANKHIPGTSVPPASYLEKFEQQFAAAPRRKRTA